MAENSGNNFGEVMESLMEGMDGLVTAKTVVGEAVQVNDTIILPLVDMSFGVGAGAGVVGEKKNNVGGGGMGAKISPSAVLVIRDGSTRLVNIKNQDTVTKVLDMVPDLIDRIVPGRDDPRKDPEVQKAVQDIAEGEPGTRESGEQAEEA